ncbi:hypothetical protein EFA69_16125 [Rufibacter immobilis]|uniref:Uncharacterized protein n=1 Tax=Rufibacter immobilis TaxID=1348778 RepID=A0A3M9MQ34_9BACT|nr:hypothetical protein [Rufibacter immobilis]RNI27644.1 hypothetical protein EFA69_16125 [Rufibacter immobilis]
MAGELKGAAVRIRKDLGSQIRGIATRVKPVERSAFEGAVLRVKLVPPAPQIIMHSLDFLEKTI